MPTSIRRRGARPIIAALIAVGFLSATAATAAAETKELTVPGTVVIQNKQRPDDPGNCAAITFVQWADQPGQNVVGGTAYYIWRGSERSKAFKPPYDDTFQFVATFQVEPGHHWTQIGKSWSDGPRPNDCSASAERTRAFYTTMEARVVLQVEVPAGESKACQDATTAASKAKAKVTSLQKRLDTASTKRGQARVRAQLRVAKQTQRAALTAQRAACTPAPAPAATPAT